MSLYHGALYDAPDRPEGRHRVLIAAYGDSAYNIVLILHILAAIVGFGAVTLNGIYGQQAKSRKGPEGLAITEANFLVSTIAEYFIYAVFILGVLLVLLSDDLFDFGQTWIWLSMLVYLAALGLSHAGLRPRVRKMIALQYEMISGGPPAGGPPPQVAQLEELGRQVGMISSLLHIALIVILVLMVSKPGAPI
jgi:uncharacterized membrane protein